MDKEKQIREMGKFACDICDIKGFCENSYKGIDENCSTRIGLGKALYDTGCRIRVDYDGACGVEILDNPQKINEHSFNKCQCRSLLRAYLKKENKIVPVNKLSDMKIYYNTYDFDEEPFGKLLIGKIKKIKPTPCDWEDCILMRCTGRCDCTGWDIYEGDILITEDNSVKYEVTWNDDHMRWELIPIDGKNNFEYNQQEQYNIWHDESLEAIGTIYDNRGIINYVEG